MPGHGSRRSAAAERAGAVEVDLDPADPQPLVAEAGPHAGPAEAGEQLLDRQVGVGERHRPGAQRQLAVGVRRLVAAHLGRGQAGLGGAGDAERVEGGLDLAQGACGGRPRRSRGRGTRRARRRDARSGRRSARRSASRSISPPTGSGVAGVDPGQRQRGAVGDRVVGAAVEEDGTAAGHRVEVGPGRQPLLRELLGLHVRGDDEPVLDAPLVGAVRAARPSWDAPAFDRALTCAPMRSTISAHRLRVADVEPAQLQARDQGVDVGVDQSRHHGPGRAPDLAPRRAARPAPRPDSRPRGSARRAPPSPRPAAAPGPSSAGRRPARTPAGDAALTAARSTRAAPSRRPRPGSGRPRSAFRVRIQSTTSWPKRLGEGLVVAQRVERRHQARAAAARAASA